MMKRLLKTRGCDKKIYTWSAINKKLIFLSVFKKTQNSKQIIVLFHTHIKIYNIFVSVSYFQYNRRSSISIHHGISIIIFFFFKILNNYIFCFFSFFRKKKNTKKNKKYTYIKYGSAFYLLRPYLISLGNQMVVLVVA